jgi:hypothetical protein
VKSEGLRAVSSLTSSLTTLNLSGCDNITSVGLACSD